LEYDFFTIDGEEEFWALINFYGAMWKRFDYYLDGYDTTENNTGLSPNVQSKMKEHNANLCLTFMEEEHKENNVQIRTMVVNEQKQDGTFDTSFFNFYLFKANNFGKYLEQGLFCAKKGLYNAAVAYYSEAIKLKPDLAVPYVCRGIAYSQRKAYKSAKADFLKALEIDPNNDGAKKNLEKLDGNAMLN
jgi:tetratricopeptide (TPR) repeat protein